jgi:hypothetical protein
VLGLFYEKWPLPSVLRLNFIPRKLLLQIPQERVRIIRLCPTGIAESGRSTTCTYLLAKEYPLTPTHTHPEVLAETWLYALWSFFSHFSKKRGLRARLSFL